MKTAFSWIGEKALEHLANAPHGIAAIVAIWAMAEISGTNERDQNYSVTLAVLGSLIWFAMLSSVITLLVNKFSEKEKTVKVEVKNGAPNGTPPILPLLLVALATLAAATPVAAQTKRSAAAQRYCLFCNCGQQNSQQAAALQQQIAALQQQIAQLQANPNLAILENRVAQLERRVDLLQGQMFYAPPSVAPAHPLPPSQPPSQPLPPSQPPSQPLLPSQPPSQPLLPSQPPSQPLPPSQPPSQPLLPSQPPSQPLPSSRPRIELTIPISQLPQQQYGRWQRAVYRR